MRFLMLLVLLICFGLSDINAAKAGWASNNNSTSSVVKALSAQDVQYMRGIVQSILVTDSKAMVEQALKSEDFRVKAAGCVLARRCGKEYLEELFEGLADDSDLVRQVSRESLHILNYMMTKKKVDFGPLPGEQSSVSACASQTLWKSHFRINENAANNKKIVE